jgi:hypothetical protein
MPQTEGAGTVFTGGPGCSIGLPIYGRFRPTSGSVPATPNLLFNSSGLLDYNALAADVLQLATVTIPNAAVKTLHSVGTQLLPAPGAGLFYDVDSIILNYIYGTAQFAAGGAIQASYGTGTTNPATATVAATFLTSPTANQIVKASGAIASELSSVVLNAALTLAAATADFTTGDGSLVVLVKYRVLPAS